MTTSAAGTTTDLEDLLTIREVAIRLRVDATTVRRWIAQGLLEVVILPHTGKRRVYRVKKATLDGLLQTGGKRL